MKFVFGMFVLMVLVACASSAVETVTPYTTLPAAPPTQIVLRATVTPPPTILPTNAPARAPQIKLTSCRIQNVDALCGTFSVYENRAAQSGRKIALRIAVVPAKTGTAEPDPIFYFTGGPGGSAVDVLPIYASAWSELNKTRDLVFVDQRGTGLSNKLVCPLPDNETLDLTDRTQVGNYVKACLAEIDGDARWYTTRAFVDDVNDVRAALGYDKINIVGGSYGAAAVQVYTLLHADSVRTMTINNGTLIDFPIMERIPASSQRALDLIFERCSKNEACQAAFPNVRTEFQTALAQLDAAPVKTKTLEWQTGAPMTVNRAVFSQVIHALLLSADTAGRVPRLIHRAATLGDWDMVAEEYNARVLSQGTESARMVMSITIRCYEPWARFSVAETKRTGAGSYLVENHAATAEVYESVCKNVPQPPTEAMYGRTVKSDVPVLVLNADEDPQNPPENVAATQSIYPNSRVLFEPYRGHSTVNWVCLTQVLGEFLASADPNAMKGECLAKVRPYPFDTRP